MNPVGKILDIPVIWGLSQAIFGCDNQKRLLYRSVFKDKGKILDFGCANGNTFPAFNDFDYYGVDINTNLINNARKKYAGYPNAHFIEADILQKPFKPESFDYVLFSCTGHHLKDEQLFPIMRELGAVLKKGGRLYLFDTIKKPGKDSLLLRTLINMDQGKFMKDEDKYRRIINNFSNDLKPVEVKTLEIRGTLFPQPTYFYTEFEKV